MADTLIKQTLPCPSCGHLLKPDVGLKIPALPEAVMWKCDDCEQPLILALLRKEEDGTWHVRAFAITPTVRGPVVGAGEG